MHREADSNKRMFLEEEKVKNHTFFHSRPCQVQCHGIMVPIYDLTVACPVRYVDVDTNTGHHLDTYLLERIDSSDKEKNMKPST